jgi:hypothetical protein
MSDERISETTGSPRCPECHGRAAWTPFGPCKMCGRLPKAGHRLPTPDFVIGPRWEAPHWVARSLQFNTVVMAVACYGLWHYRVRDPVILLVVVLAGLLPWAILSIVQALLNWPPSDPEN